MNPSTLTLFRSPFSKQRLGRKFDGGYVVCNIPNVEYDVLLSAGIDRDTSFEDEWLEKYPTKKCIAFDGTITECPSKHSNFIWVNKNIGGSSDSKHTNLHDILDSNNSIFLKMDIEGAEIPWLQSLSSSQMNKLSQIVIEFHSPFSRTENAMFEKINKTHKLLHFHGNNCCGTREHNGVVIPNVFECTYVHNRYITGTLELNKEPLPTKLDEPNIQGRDDIVLTNKPFVN
jgi:hypothetical protein